jgi:K+/H+ antiporter YhaU regulatory subunit KhtT
VIILAVKKASGAMLFSPTGNTPIDEGDLLIAMGERSQLIRMATETKVQKPGNILQ